MNLAKRMLKWPINHLALPTLLLLFVSIFASGQEICDNAIDDDGDGLIDLNDIEDCACSASFTALDILPNPSFEDNVCCPQTFNPSGQFCVEGWQEGTLGSADYINTCGYLGDAPLPLPDGNGAIAVVAGIFDDFTLVNEYAATCFDTPLQPTDNLSLTISVAAGSLDQTGVSSTTPPADQPAPITIYGTQNCFFPEESFGCPEDIGWTVLGSTNYLPENSWSEISIDLNIEEPIAGLAFGVGCDMPVSYQLDQSFIVAPYFYFDNFELISDQNTVVVGPIESNYAPCNESVTLQAPEGNFTYQWYFEGVAINGETNDQLFIELSDGNEVNAGQYQLVLSDNSGGCITREIEVATLVNDLIIGAEPTSGCAPLQVSFDANLASGSQPLFWTVGDQVIEGLFFENTFTEPGVYPVSAQFTDINGCVFTAESDPIIVQGSEELDIEFEVLGACAPFEVELSAPNLGEGCIWTLQDGTLISTDCSFTYLFNGDEDFLVEVISESDCPAFGSSVIPISPIEPEELIVEFEVLNDCAPFEVQFSTSNSPGGCIWTLEDGTVIGTECSFVYTFNGEDDFLVEVVSDSECPTFGSSLVPILPIEPAQLDITYEVLNGCPPFEVELSTTNSDGGCSWTLQDGTIIGNGCTITYLYDDEVDFVVNVTSTADCPSSGSANIPIVTAEQGEYTIDGNLSFCEGDSSVISALPNTNTYIWNENFSGNNFTVFEAGIYQVRIIEPNGCDYFETFSVETSDGPEFSPPSIVSGCIGDNLDFSEFTTTREIFYEEPEGAEFIGFQGEITVTATDECGSTERNVEVILEDCSCQVYVPNSFSPNGDGLNDLFRPSINCDLREYRMVIFNRWGNEVFSTDSYDRGWDGSSKDEKFFSNTAVYNYLIRYDSSLKTLNEPIELVGSITLIR
ncbi:MAG: gliding motility-associated C-terminal domain-containing protein [Flavobacteriales bacterium]|nr:gliding motility-associated C-terminal domain-containing protein [Flavobacteriales bacterium]